MPANVVFVDTWGLLALINRDDQWHRQAVDLSREFHAQMRPLLTTEWVLAEFLGGAARPALRPLAIQGVHQLRSSPRVEIVPVSSNDWDEGFQLYQARPDKAWSLVDCISILLCQRRGIIEVFTRDHHFEQAGLQILLGGST
jgi:uncharacterized protein